MKAQGGVEVYLHSLILTLDGVGDHNHAPAALPQGKRPGAYCTGRRVMPRAGLDGCEISLPPPRFDPRTFQPVVSRYS
jgi:hypothetical protein